MNWALIVKKLRDKLLLTQTEFANLLGVSYATVNRWEKGHFEPTMAQKREIKMMYKKNKIEWED